MTNFKGMTFVRIGSICNVNTLHLYFCRSIIKDNPIEVYEV